MGRPLLADDPLDDNDETLLECRLFGASLLVDGVSLDDGVLLSTEDDESDELGGTKDEPLSLELLVEELPLEFGGDDELGGVEELGADDDGVLGVELLDDGAELDGPLLDSELDELSLEELSLSELLEELLDELLDELSDDDELLDELEQQSQQQQPAW